MPDRDRELCAEICRQAALPMLRQRLELVVPKKSEPNDHHRETEDRGAGKAAGRTERP